MTPEKYDRIAAQTMEVVKEFAETEDAMKDIIGTMLQFAVKVPVFGNQYAQLCKHLFGHLRQLALACDYKWVLEDKDISKTFRQMVVAETHSLFLKHKDHSPSDMDLDEDGNKITNAEDLEIKRLKLKNNFFAVCTLAAEL